MSTGSNPAAVRDSRAAAASVELAQVNLKRTKELLDKGLVEGTSGNISARMEDGNIAVTPSSLDYRIMTPDDPLLAKINREAAAVFSEATFAPRNTP